jgi:hypothetical protein
MSVGFNYEVLRNLQWPEIVAPARTRTRLPHTIRGHSVRRQRVIDGVVRRPGVRNDGAHRRCHPETIAALDHPQRSAPSNWHCQRSAGIRGNAGAATAVKRHGASDQPRRVPRHSNLHVGVRTPALAARTPRGAHLPRPHSTARRARPAAPRTAPRTRTAIGLAGFAATPAGATWRDVLCFATTELRNSAYPLVRCVDPGERVQTARRAA